MKASLIWATIRGPCGRCCRRPGLVASQDRFGDRRPQAVAALANLVIRHRMPTGLHPVCDAGPIRHRDTSPLGRASAKALSCIGLRTFVDKIDYPRYPAEIQAIGEWLNTLAHKVIQGLRCLPDAAL